MNTQLVTEELIYTTYYIGHISCTTKNAMMQKIAEYLSLFEQSLYRGASTDLFIQMRAYICKICEDYPKCKKVELTWTTTPSGVVFYATNSTTGTSLIHIPLSDVKHVIRKQNDNTLQEKE